MRILHTVLNELSFGGGAINDTLMHLANLIYHLVVSECLALDNIMVNILSNNFSHSKSYIFRSTRLDSSVMYPPYKGKFKYIRTFLKLINLQKATTFYTAVVSILLK